MGEKRAAATAAATDDRISQMPDGKPRLGHWRVADSRECRRRDDRLVGVDPPRGRQQRPSEFERARRCGRAEGGGEARVSGDPQAEYAELGCFHTMPAPDLTSPVEVAIMDDLARRMGAGGVPNPTSEQKPRRMKLKPMPAVLLRAVRDYVRTAKVKRKAKRAKKRSEKDVTQPAPQLEVAVSEGSLLTAEEERPAAAERFQLPAQCESVDECPMVEIFDALERVPDATISPGLREAVALSFYFGRINRHEAARLLEGQKHGTFLLRDSSHPDFGFAVSFVCNEAVVHARICFSRGLYAFRLDSKRFCSPSLAAFIANYKTSRRESYDEPALLHPFQRKDPFSLQFLSLAAVVSVCSVHNLRSIRLPDQLKRTIVAEFLVQ
ncbi:Suppressor of cytokine signaling 5-like, protein [Aphelenchoides fujianensis]|nr:Suppressor of cytokine signaling 5-like, protein [Aphelenchoides fujianensis]